MTTGNAILLSCPACSTRLRLSVDSLDLPYIRCPECSSALIIAAPSGRFEARLVSSLAAEPEQVMNAFPSAKRFDQQTRARLIAGTLVLIFAIATLSFLFPSNDDRLAVTSDPAPETPQPEGAEVVRTEPAPPILEQPVAVIAEPDTAVLLPIGEPLAPQSDAIPVAPVLLAPEAPAVNEPNAVVPAPGTPPPFDSASARLNVLIASFEQTTPIPAAELIDIVEQMAGVEVQVPEDSSAILSRRVTLKLRETSPFGILTALAQQLGLRVEIQGDSVRLSPQPAP